MAIRAAASVTTPTASTAPPANDKFGIPDPKITTMPDYTRSIKSARDSGDMPTHYLPYEWSPHTKVEEGSLTQWHEFMAKSERKVDESMKILRAGFNERIPARADDASMTLRDLLTQARKTVDAEMQHDPAHPRFEKNEVPRWKPDGTLHPDDAKFFDEATGQGKSGTRLMFDPPAQAHMETLLYRVPAETIEQQHWPAIHDASDKVTKATQYMTYNASPSGHPDIEQAYKLLRGAKSDLRQALKEAGASSANASPINRIWNRVLDMTPKERLFTGAGVVGAVGLAGAIAAVVIVHDTHD